MNWLDEYRKRRVPVDEAVNVLRSGMRVYVSGNAATPYALLRGLVERASDFHDVEVTHVLMVGDDPLSDPKALDHFRHNSLFVGSADRAVINQGKGDCVPVHLHRIPSLFTEGLLPLDAAIIHTAPPDEHGFMSLGVECLATLGALSSAPLVIAQVNERMPRTMGDCFVHLSRITKLVEAPEELPELESVTFGEAEEKIGERVADLVEDGSTLQLGIGGIPDAVLSFLKARKDLGIHTEMVSDGIVSAVESGIVTGARKTVHRGKVICTFALGSRRLYDYLHNNPLFEFHPVDYTNHPFIISQNDKMVAVNSAIEIDLTGQVCSDSIGTRIYSGFGGQVDFIRGAAHSRGGKPIIAVPATARGGAVSRIVPTLRPGAGVVTTRADVHFVVTEYGTAALQGRNLRERAEALISIAAPQFREELERAARERKLLPEAINIPVQG